MNHEVLGWIASALPCFVLVASATMKLTNHPVVVKNLTEFGFKQLVLRPMGILEYALVALYLFPATSFIGLILLTGWLGGAIATHFRAGDKFVVQTMLPILLWIGWSLRHEAVVRAALGFGTVG